MSCFEVISTGWRYRTIFCEHVPIIYLPSDFVQTASLNDLQLIFLEPVLYSGLRRTNDHQESITILAHYAIRYRACAHLGGIERIVLNTRDKTLPVTPDLGHLVSIRSEPGVVVIVPALFSLGGVPLRWPQNAGRLSDSRQPSPDQVP